MRNRGLVQEDTVLILLGTACCLQLVPRDLPGSERIECSSSIRSQEEWAGGADPASWSGTTQ